MAAVKFVTVKGSTKFALNPFYIGLVQRDRTMGKREAYDFLAEATGYKAAAIRAVFMGLKQYIRTNAARGNITYIDEVASIRNVVRGAFASNAGPWVKGKNYLQVVSVEMDPFKSVLADITPTNKTEGAKPTIYTVLDETTREYDVITGTDDVSIAGADLAPDTTRDDEGVFAVDKDGKETKAEITFSDLQNVKFRFATALPAGSYTLVVKTRSGLGSEFGVARATRKIEIA